MKINKKFATISYILAAIIMAPVALRGESAQSENNQSSQAEKSSIEAALVQLSQNRVNRAGFKCKVVEESVVWSSDYVYLACDGYQNTYKVKKVNGMISINGTTYANL